MKVTLSNGKEYPHISWANLSYADSEDEPYEEWAKDVQNAILDEDAKVEVSLNDLLVLLNNVNILKEQVEKVSPHTHEIIERRGEGAFLMYHTEPNK